MKTRKKQKKEDEAEKEDGKRNRLRRSKRKASVLNAQKKLVKAREKAWDKQYNELVKFYNKNGHCRVQKDQERLYGWCVGQQRQVGRSNYSPRRIAKLNAIGFWDYKKKNSHKSSSTGIDEQEAAKHTNNNTNTTTTTTNTTTTTTTTTNSNNKNNANNTVQRRGRGRPRKTTAPDQKKTASSTFESYFLKSANNINNAQSGNYEQRLALNGSIGERIKIRRRSRYSSVPANSFTPSLNESNEDEALSSDEASVTTKNQEKQKNFLRKGIPLRKRKLKIIVRMKQN